MGEFFKILINTGRCEKNSLCFQFRSRRTTVRRGFKCSVKRVEKRASDNYAIVFNQVYRLETVCLHYFNVYEPRQANNPYSGAITIFANDLLGNRMPKIFGDGKQTRDFVFVEDVVSANLLALTKKKATGEVFNISSGEATTINRLVQMMQEITGKTKLKPIYKEVRLGDIRHSHACIDKARKILGYEPHIPLEVGLRKLVRHMVSYV